MKFIILFFLISRYVYCSAQNEAKQWVVNKNVIEFENGEIKVVDSLAKGYFVFDSTFIGENPIANICDAKGKLLMYATNNNIYNKYHEIIENGASIINNYQKNNLLIIPTGIKKKNIM